MSSDLLVTIELYCKKCGWGTPHKIKEVKRDFAWWRCVIEGCKEIKSGPHPSRGWVKKQLKRQRDEKQLGMF